MLDRKSLGDQASWRICRAAQDAKIFLLGFFEDEKAVVCTKQLRPLGNEQLAVAVKGVPLEGDLVEPS